MTVTGWLTGVREEKDGRTGGRTGGRTSWQTVGRTAYLSASDPVSCPRILRQQNHHSSTRSWRNISRPYTYLHKLVGLRTGRWPRRAQCGRLEWILNINLGDASIGTFAVVGRPFHLGCIHLRSGSRYDAHTCTRTDPLAHEQVYKKTHIH